MKRGSERRSRMWSSDALECLLPSPSLDGRLQILAEQVNLLRRRGKCTGGESDLYPLELTD